MLPRDFKRRCAHGILTEWFREQRAIIQPQHAAGDSRLSPGSYKFQAPPNPTHYGTSSSRNTFVPPPLQIDILLDQSDSFGWEESYLIFCSRTMPKFRPMFSVWARSARAGHLIVYNDACGDYAVVHMPDGFRQYMNVHIDRPFVDGLFQGVKGFR